MEIVLTIAGSDPSAGAGIQQDLKTITAMGCYGATVITALTSQNTMGVQHVMAVPPEVVQSQLESIFSDLDVGAVKIGQLPDAGVARVVTDCLKAQNDRRSSPLPIVCDPVMISTSGHRLMAEDCVNVVEAELFPMASLVTPNIPEAESLSAQSIRSEADIVAVGRMLAARYGTHILMKGGHARGGEMTDRLLTPDGIVTTLSSPRIATRNLHGTGCTLSSAIASQLAKGRSMTEAVTAAKTFVDDAIRGGKDLHVGHGNGPLWASMSQNNPQVCAKTGCRKLLVKLLMIGNEMIYHGQQYFQSLNRLALMKRTDELCAELKSTDLHQRNVEAFAVCFDETMRHLFPNLAEQVNALLLPDEKLTIPQDSRAPMTTEMRLLCLLCVGITDNKELARFLNCNASTVSTYRSRLRARAVHKDLFEEQLLIIGRSFK